jgi:hypothetical protein
MGTFVVGILKFIMWFDVDIFDFQFKLCYRYLGIFFKTSGHPESKM